MSHMIETMAYVGNKPWHGLGAELSSCQPIEVWAQQAGLDWTIYESPVCFSSRNESDSERMHQFLDNKVLYRSDTNAALSVVGQRYKVVQPNEILEFYRDLTEQSGFELETAGVLRGGRKIWALARTGQSTAIKGSDVSNGYVLLATACDGTLATTAQFTSVRVVCNNTLAVALGGREKAVKVPHRTDFDPVAVKRQLGISVSAWDSFMYTMKVLSDRKVNDVDVSRFLRKVFSDESKEVPLFNERAASATKLLFDGAGRGAELQSAKGTAFGLLNSVTEFVDHMRRARDADYRLESAWFGQGASLKQKALDQSLAMIA
jgi:phage/plasmid-like protein (TIGR03299 family)